MKRYFLSLFFIDFSLSRLGQGPKSAHRPARLQPFHYDQVLLGSTHLSTAGNKLFPQLPFVWGYNLDFFEKACDSLLLPPFFLSAASELGHMGGMPHDKPMNFALSLFFYEKTGRWFLLETECLCPPTPPRFIC